jgi:ribosome-associated translation inhibitor RaiA
MTNSDFRFEFYSEITDLEANPKAEAENRLLALTKGHDDLIGASVMMEELTGETTPHRFEATVVVYIRPENIAAKEKAETPEGALKGALSAVERQVRELRDRLRKTWA